MRKKCPYSEFFWSLFSRIQTEYGIWENTDQNNTFTQCTTLLAFVLIKPYYVI